VLNQDGKDRIAAVGSCSSSDFDLIFKRRVEIREIMKKTTNLGMQTDQACLTLREQQDHLQTRCHNADSVNDLPADQTQLTPRAKSTDGRWHRKLIVDSLTLKPSRPTLCPAAPTPSRAYITLR
jgi:Tfp pilus assembly ATPase PilU